MFAERAFARVYGREFALTCRVYSLRVGHDIGQPGPGVGLVLLRRLLMVVVAVIVVVVVMMRVRRHLVSALAAARVM